MSWPVNPTNGQQTTVNGIIYQYDAAINAWNRVTSSSVNMTVAKTVSDNAQPNITSVGTLISLDVSGNISGNFILGNGYYLTGITSGGGTNYANSNVAAYLPINTSNVKGNYIIGNGSTLTNLTGANVTGYVPLATAANRAGTVTTNAQPNITSLGTLTGITSSGYANLETVNITGVTTISYPTQSTGTGTGAFRVLGGASITKDLWVGGTLHVPNLDVTTYNEFKVDVPLIYLEANTTYPYSYDIGFYSQFTGGLNNNYQHTGLVRNHDDNAWYLFSNIASEPSGGTVDLSNANIVFDTLKVGNVVAMSDLTVNGSVIGNLIPATNELQDLGSDTHRWRDLYLSGNTLKIGGTAINAIGNTLSTSTISVTDTVTASNVTTTTISSNTGSLTDLTVSANLTTDLLSVANSITANSVVVSANIESNNVVATGDVSVTGNVDSGNISVTGTVETSTVVATGNISSENIAVTGNASVGNVSTTGVTTSTISISTLANISNANIVTLVSDTVSTEGLSISGNATINSATITSMIGNIVGGNSVTSNNLTINDIASILTAQITTLTANTSTSNNLTINETATIANISANATTSNNLTINDTATIATISANVTTSNNITINQTATIANISANATTSNNITINDTATIDTADITTADIVSLTIDEATSNSLVINNLANIGSANIGNAEITGTLTAPSLSGGTGTFTGAISAAAATFSGLVTATAGGLKVTTIYDSTGTATITTRYGSLAGDVGITGNLTVGTGGSGKITTTSLVVTGQTTLKQSQEGFVAKSGATGTVAHDFSTGTTFYHTGILANFTCNVTNLDTTAGRATVIVLILAQGSTPYICNALQIGGSAQTIKWVNATTPTGTASRVEAIVFTIFNNSGTYTVLGQLSSYG